jgi:hypothetical protein
MTGEYFLVRHYMPKPHDGVAEEIDGGWSAM